MSNRTIVELNHDYCPRGDDASLLAWAKAMRFYMGGADQSMLPDGVTFLHYRHHSEDCPLPVPPQKPRKRVETMSALDSFRAAAIPAMRAAMDAIDAEIVRQERAGYEDDEVRELANAADGLREVLRSMGEDV